MSNMDPACSYQDKAMMLDPSTSNCRVFVKNTPNATRQDLEVYFKKHGNVVGIMQQRNYCFIQYENEDSATEAIRRENGSSFMGKIIEVSQARKPMDKQALAQHKAQRGGRGGAQPQRGGSNNTRDRSPHREDWDDPRYDYDYAARSRAYSDPYYSQDRVVDPQTDRTNDCEIIVHNKKQRAYAEMIELRLKSYGLSVDLMFPNESIPVTRVLATISSRGTLYAITVSPQNEEHQSLTLNILHGSPEEHRNMPLDAAIQLITRNYDSFMKGGGTRAAGGSSLSNVPKSAVLVATNHPENISAMLQLLVQNRSLTVLQYDTILRYLSQRREQQVKLEVGDTNMGAAPPMPITIPPEHIAPAPTPVPAPHPAQAEQLQKRILSILDKKMTPAPVPAPSAAPQGKGIMQDPKVQMALSSLLGSGSFKNFGQRQ